MWNTKLTANPWISINPTHLSDIHPLAHAGGPTYAAATATAIFAKWYCGCTTNIRTFINLFKFCVIIVIIV